MKDNELKKFWTSYRGYVHLYTPIMAINEDEAHKIAQTLPHSPKEDLELVVTHYDCDFELDEECYIYNDAEIHKQEVPKAFSKQIIKAGLAQEVNRAKRNAERERLSLEKQIQQAQDAFASTLATLTSKLEALNE